MSEAPLILGGDAPISTFNLPIKIDHSWLMISQNINERLRNPPSNSHKLSIIERIDQVDDARFRLHLSKTHRWSDGALITSLQVAECLVQGSKYRKACNNLEVCFVDKTYIDIRIHISQHDLDLTLQRPAYTMTPSLRKGSRVSVGSYSPIGMEDRGHSLIFAANKYHASIRPESAQTIVTHFGDTAQQAGDKLLRGEIDLTAALGIDPSLWRRHPKLILSSNIRTSYFFTLTGFHKLGLASRPLACLIDLCIDRLRLAEATEHSALVPITTSPIRGMPVYEMPDIRTPIELYYTDFEPNPRIASQLKKQIEEHLNISISLKCVDYHEYLAGRFDDKPALFLEIISDLGGDLGKGYLVSNACRPFSENTTLLKDFVVILQCQTTLMRSPLQNDLHVHPDSHAIINWSEIRR